MTTTVYTTSSIVPLTLNGDVDSNAVDLIVNNLFQDHLNDFDTLWAAAPSIPLSTVQSYIGEMDIHNPIIPQDIVPTEPPPAPVFDSDGNLVLVALNTATST